MDSGWLILNKPPGITSSRVVHKVSRLFATKAGHGGTLDPSACGVLPIGVGNKACKCLGYILESDKKYLFTVLWGIKTDTLDMAGRCRAYSPKVPGEQEILNSLSSFVGELEQVPPVFSAIKQGGIPHYKRARKGEEIVVAPRKIKVHSLELLEHCHSRGVSKFQVWCSKGFYVRSLARDLGDALGTFGCVEKIQRTKAGFFHIKDAVLMEDLTHGTGLLPLDYPFKEMSKIEVDQEQAAKLRNGMSIVCDGNQGSFTIYSENSMIGFGVRRGAMVFPKKILADSVYGNK